MKEYDIAVGNSPAELRTEVKEMIARGFIPQGGVFVEYRTQINKRNEESDTWYYQAMIKE